MNIIEKSWKKILKNYSEPTVLKDKLLKPYFSKVKLAEPILDIGYGTGYFSELISRKSNNIFAVDLFDNTPESSKVQYYNMDAASLNFPDKTFGDILMINVLSCVDTAKKRIKILSEANRVKKDTAKIYLVLMSESLHKTPIDDRLLKTESINSRKFKLTFTKKNNQKISFDDYLITKNELEKYLKKTNLKLIKEHPFMHNGREIYKLFIIE